MNESINPHWTYSLTYILILIVFYFLYSIIWVFKDFLFSFSFPLCVFVFHPSSIFFFPQNVLFHLVIQSDLLSLLTSLLYIPASFKIRKNEGCKLSDSILTWNISHIIIVLVNMCITYMIEKFWQSLLCPYVYLKGKHHLAK